MDAGGDSQEADPKERWESTRASVGADRGVFVCAGCRAAITEELLSTIRLTRYRSTLASLTYDEYQKLKYGSTDDDL